MSYHINEYICKRHSVLYCKTKRFVLRCIVAERMSRRNLGSPTCRQVPTLRRRKKRARQGQTNQLSVACRLNRTSGLPARDPCDPDTILDRLHSDCSISRCEVIVEVLIRSKCKLKVLKVYQRICIHKIFVFTLQSKNILANPIS